MPTSPQLRQALGLGVACVVVAATSGCSLLHRGKKNPATTESVMNVQASQCFAAPGKVVTELASVKRTPCDVPHELESYATIAYPTDVKSPPYPGNGVLTDFAQGHCAQQYRSYVGVDYLDSKLFYTFLLPSPRSWDKDKDRTVICFVTTTGQPLTASVKGSKL